MANALALARQTRPPLHISRPCEPQLELGQGANEMKGAHDRSAVELQQNAKVSPTKRAIFKLSDFTKNCNKIKQRAIISLVQFL